jgi:hypothetical protein
MRERERSIIGGEKCADTQASFLALSAGPSSNSSFFTAAAVSASVASSSSASASSSASSSSPSSSSSSLATALLAAPPRTASSAASGRGCEDACAAATAPLRGFLCDWAQRAGDLPRPAAALAARNAELEPPRKDRARPACERSTERKQASVLHSRGRLTTCRFVSTFSYRVSFVNANPTHLELGLSANVRWPIGNAKSKLPRDAPPFGSTCPRSPTPATLPRAWAAAT